VVARQFHPYKKEWRWFHYLSSVTPDKKGNAFFFDGIVRDVTEEKNKQYEMAKHRDRLSELVKSQNTNLIEVNSNLNKEIENRKKSEAQLKKALQEKEVLIRETHHRVKNNLQSIANLLDLESMHSPDEKALQAFQDCRDRVRAMCMVHRQLYQTESLSQIPLAPYAKDLARQLFKAYGAPPAKISIRINAPEVYLVMDVAIVCGLILNEFISNSLKYAFSEHENGILIFEARKLKNETIELFYSDNGKGLPVGLDPAKAETLGLKMVYYLVEKQLAGKLVHIKGPGCAFRLVFKNLDQEKRSASFSC
jgi:two-component sensor histidine kinase